MNREDIIAMAEQAAMQSETFVQHGFDDVFLERFAALVAEHEREMCAKVCEGLEHKLRNTSYTPNGFSCANAIRARGEE